MPLCDLCGKQTQLSVATIERAVLKVCSDCAKYGDSKPQPAKSEEFENAAFEVEERRLRQFSAVPKPPQDEIIDENYPMLVKMAREKMKLTHQQLAQAIAEKESIIHKIETKQQEIPLKTAKKLEQFLRIKLIIKNEPQAAPSINDMDFTETSMTIGDLLKLEKNLKETSK